METDDFKATVGLYQGSTLSPFLLVLLMDCFNKEIQREASWDKLFADDVVTNAQTTEELKAEDVQGCNGNERPESN